MTAPPTVGDMMAAYAEDAVEHARAAAGVELDYSAESVRGVEEVLKQLHAVMPKGFLGRLLGRGPSAEDLDKVCKMYGGYVGEVFRRSGGGEWGFDEEIVPGQRVLCLRKGDAKVWPPAKVGKRLTAGAADDVWAYAQAILREW